MSDHRLKYISGAPIGEDLLEGKSHEKIAGTLFGLIKDKSLPNNVIGLEGEWGAGKSNVIGMLNKKFDSSDSDYFFFTYDAWGHQEDLTRKTFLEELITDLGDKDKFKNDIDWKRELKKLLSKTSTKTTEKYPKVKIFWILFIFSLALFSLNSVLYEDFFLKIDLIESVTLEKTKLFLLKYLLPITVFIWGVFELRNSYRSLRKKGIKKREVFKRLLYVFSGSDLESEELEHILEEEPSVKSFNEYFSKITSDLKSDGLIIVFDNMDRLSNSSKVLSLWSSIHTFFAEEEIPNVWVIIPYDKQHLSKHFIVKELKGSNLDTVNDFINKTFSTTFRISPPVLSDWKKFFKLKLCEGFDGIIEDDQLDFISSLYEQIIDLGKRKPRDIITFVNSLISLYLQHGDDIEVKYQALFLLRKREVLDNPLISISSKYFLKEESHLFTDLTTLEQSLAALVYNIDKNKASEVLLKNSIEELFLRPDKESLEAVKKHSEFEHYLSDLILTGNIDRFKAESVTSILEDVKDEISETKNLEYWEKFSMLYLRKEAKLFTTVNEWHKSFMLNTSKATAKKIADRIAESALNSFENSKNDENPSGKTSNYYSVIHDLLKFTRSNSIDIKVEIEKTKFDAESFISYIDDMADVFEDEICEYEDLQIFTDNKELVNYFISMEEGITDYTFTYLHVISYLIKNDKPYNFDLLKENIDLELDNVEHTEKEKINKLIKIEQVLWKRNETHLFPETTFDNYLNNNGPTDESIYYNVIANQIAHMSNGETITNDILSDELKSTENANEVSKIIQYYIDFGDLLKLGVKTGNEYVLIKKLIHNILNNPYGFKHSLDVKWVFDNLNNIEVNLFENEFDLFLKRFNDWASHFEAKIDLDSIFELPETSLNYILDESNHEYKTVAFMYELALKKLKNSTKQDWLDNFNSNSNFERTYIGLVVNDLMKTEITKGTDHMDAYLEYFKSMAKRETDIHDDSIFWDELLSKGYLDGRRLKRIYNDVLDSFLDHTELENKELLFFSLGLFKYASNLYSNITDSDKFIRKYILRLESFRDEFKTIFTTYKDQLVKIINNSSGSYNVDLTNLFRQTIENKFIEDTSIIEEIATYTGIDLTSDNDTIEDDDEAKE